MCFPSCLSQHQATKECAVLAGAGAKFGADLAAADNANYHAIVPLRLMLMAEEEPKMFALISRLMDHKENRMKER